MRTQSMRRFVRSCIAAGVVAGFSSLAGLSYGVLPHGHKFVCYFSDLELDRLNPFAAGSSSIDCVLDSRGVDKVLRDAVYEQDELQYCVSSEENARILSYAVDFWQAIPSPTKSPRSYAGFESSTRWMAYVVQFHLVAANWAGERLAELQLRDSNREHRSPVTNDQGGNIFVFVYSQNEESDATNLMELQLDSSDAERVSTENFDTKVSIASPSDHVACQNPIQKGMDPICPELQNAAASTYDHPGFSCDFESCFADLGSEPNPPQSTLEKYTEPHSLSASDSVASTAERPPMLEGDLSAIVDPSGIGHCLVSSKNDVANLPMIVELARLTDEFAHPDHDLDTIQSNGDFANEKIRPYHPSPELEGWLQPNWTADSWRNEIITGRSRDKYSENWSPQAIWSRTRSITKIIAEIPVDSNLVELYSIEEPAYPPNVNSLNAEPWLEELVGSVTHQFKDQLRMWRPTWVESKARSSKVLAIQMKSAAAFLQNLAHRLEGYEADLAGRESALW